MSITLNKLGKNLLKTLVVLLMFFNFNISFANESDNFFLAIKSSFQKSTKIKSANYIYLSKAKLINSSNSSKDWESFFTTGSIS